jgi:hypothetical protein
LRLVINTIIIGETYIIFPADDLNLKVPVDMNKASDVKPIASV